MTNQPPVDYAAVPEAIESVRRQIRAKNADLVQLRAKFGDLSFRATVDPSLAPEVDKLRRQVREAEDQVAELEAAEAAGAAHEAEALRRWHVEQEARNWDALDEGCRTLEAEAANLQRAIDALLVAYARTMPLALRVHGFVTTLRGGVAIPLVDLTVAGYVERIHPQLGVNIIEHCTLWRSYRPAPAGAETRDAA